VTEQKETGSHEASEQALALSEVNSNLTRALEALEDVPAHALASEAAEDRYSLQELIAQAGQIVASELAMAGAW
jgi:hypothetical protein